MARTINQLRSRVEQLIKATISDKEQRDNALFLLGMIFIDFPEVAPDPGVVAELKKRGQVV